MIKSSSALESPPHKASSTTEPLLRIGNVYHHRRGHNLATVTSPWHSGTGRDASIRRDAGHATHLAQRNPNKIAHLLMMKPQRIAAMLLCSAFGTAGLTHAAVIRRTSDEAAPLTQRMDSRPVATGFIGDTQDESGVELMKKKKKKKKKKSKAS